MGFTKEQTELLEAPLSKAHVKSRSQSGRDVSYIEGWHAIAEANRIFGYGAWSRETVELKEICRYETKSSKGGTNWKVGYEAKVCISVDIRLPNGEYVNGIKREGTGHGQGTMGDLFDAMESAAKEAETDAMKRALMTFGNQFGLALYDKMQANVEKTPPARPAQRPELTTEQKAAAALDHAKLHAQAAEGFDKVKYANANRDVINRIVMYPEAKQVLKDAGLVEA